MNIDKSAIVSEAANMLLDNNRSGASTIISQKYPHRYVEIKKRTYTMEQKMEQFVSDGFVDRYTGEKLVNPGVLKVLPVYFPEQFPYHAHWKMTETHMAYWELIPTIDHVYPIAKGGRDEKQNWVTTSMKNNAIKSNYTIDEIHWTLHPRGSIADWDGLTSVFLALVSKDKELLRDAYIRSWHAVSQKVFSHTD